MTAVCDVRKWEVLKPKSVSRYRIVPEQQLIDMLLLQGWAFEVARGGRAEAERETRRSVDRWIGLGLGYKAGDPRGRLFDPIEVVNFCKWLGAAGEDDFWSERIVVSHRRHVEAFRKASPPNAPHQLEPARFRMRLEREYNLSTFRSGAHLRLRLPLPIDGHGLTDLSVEPFASPGDAELKVRGERLEAKLCATGASRFTLGANLTFTATAGTESADHLSGDARELYLRRSEWPIAVTPRVGALAAHLSAGERTPHDVVARFWDFMLDELMLGLIRYGEAPRANAPDWVLDNGWYDCQLGSALFISLCRASGVPARMVSGHFLYPLMPNHHYWSEVWFDDRGWTPFDTVGWELSHAGRDPDWRDTFAGSIDYRSASECFPGAFTGPMSVRFPEAFQMVTTPHGDGIEIAYLDVKDGALVFRERISVDGPSAGDHAGIRHAISASASL